MADRRWWRVNPDLEDPAGISPSGERSRYQDAARQDHAVGVEGDDADGHSDPPRVDRSYAQQHRSALLATKAREPAGEVGGEENIVYFPSVAANTHPAVRSAHWYASATMAKAKRRKLRARRSKANHGRKPNAGRG